MASDYTEYGYNKYLQKINGISIKEEFFVPGIDFDKQYEVQTKKIRASRVDIQEFIQNSEIATASGTFGNGQAVTVSTTLTPQVPFQNDPNFAIPYVAMYEGTAAVGSMQIYPRQGAGISVGDYNIYSGFDISSFNGTNSVWRAHVENVAAGDVDIYFQSQWKYIYYNAGTSL